MRQHGECKESGVDAKGHPKTTRPRDPQQSTSGSGRFNPSCTGYDQVRKRIAGEKLKYGVKLQSGCLISFYYLQEEESPFVVLE